MKINTKVVFEWNPESKQYEEVYCESYDYDGEVAKCQDEEEEDITVRLPQEQGEDFWKQWAQNFFKENPLHEATKAYKSSVASGSLQPGGGMPGVATKSAGIGSVLIAEY